MHSVIDSIALFALMEWYFQYYFGFYGTNG